MNKIFNLTKKAVKWYFDRTMDNCYMYPSGMIPYNYFKNNNNLDN